jgi:ABC-type uncharacterized transport system ATPase subunit
MTGERETNTVSVERVKDYCDVAPEAALRNEATRPPREWPTRGVIELQGLEMRYRPELETVLKGLNLTVGAGEKVGIAGRTGAGKSSLVLVLLRIVEPSAGRVLIDGVDICQIGLHDLRSSVAIIPQGVCERACMRSGAFCRAWIPCQPLLTESFSSKQGGGWGAHSLTGSRFLSCTEKTLLVRQILCSL